MKPDINPVCRQHASSVLLITVACLVLAGCMGMQDRKGAPKWNALFKAFEESDHLTAELADRLEDWSTSQPERMGTQLKRKQVKAFQGAARDWLLHSIEVGRTAGEVIRSMETESEEYFTPYLKEAQERRLKDAKESHQKLVESMSQLRARIGDFDRIFARTVHPDEVADLGSIRVHLESDIERFRLSTGDFIQVMVKNELY